MNIKSKDEIRDIIAKDFLSIHNRSVELRKRLDENFEDSVTYLRALVSQLSQHSSGPLVVKTPKIVRKKAVQRIETIPENEVFQREDISSVDSLQSLNEQKQEANEEMVGGRVKRSASKKAADNIKKQYSITLSGKLRQPSDENENENVITKKIKRESQIKRKKSATSSSDEEDTKSGSKYSKIDENQMEIKRSTRRTTKKKFEQIDEQQPVVVLTKTKQVEKIKKRDISESPKSIRSSRSSSKKSQKEANEVNDVMSNIDDVEEPSMYEDAIGKPIPIMNSTMKSSSALSGKIFDATVVLGRVSQKKLNETVVIQKAPSKKNGQSNKRTSVRNNLQSNEQTIQYNNYDELITDDESSPEEKQKKQNIKNEKTRAISMSSEDEIPNTPMETRIKDMIASTATHEAKITYKSNALFSPYAKESVKKRVEAFEQAVMYSPKSVDVDIPVRVTRTKTRAMIATGIDTNNSEKNVAQILARKSLAKAKRISLAKQKKGNEEFKENKEQMPERIAKLLLNDKSNIKQTQLQKVTPLSKIRMIQPSTSVNRIHTPSHAQNLLNYPKALTASRSNIVSNIDSFIQPPKSISKATSVEKLEDKRRHEEDVKKKREEALRLQTEEKKRKRQEKELKNKLAREAKEKQELVKRQKAEREREEKARLALLMQEKQREELEKKRLAQLQRAQEKEERRKLEEQQRLQKLQEQEETERLLAEQKRREQEAEKRKEMEARTQAAEALKQKNQMLAAQAKYKQAKNQGVTNYVLDSDPDDDDSDDESRPKHEIPYWAQPHVRKAQLGLQRYIAQEFVFKLFDTRKCTPNLAELFTGIDRTRLERTSSAIWKTPPRYSMMKNRLES
ncbi:calponin homology domain-containing protein DDB_G0272472-like [Cataglyphis hispanica]|uniref:calponin homology domain-containing protein DDB_G0272472-like n=1 Tax=Cataglyphis hispanica TaxID=1086592 RepID=UPI00217F6004|nr:calponin homology domain-containing protein DDB_G0272472-like [Cataglyphis hispanica]